MESSNLVGMASIDADISDGGNVDIDLCMVVGYLQLNGLTLMEHSIMLGIRNRGAEIIDEWNSFCLRSRCPMGCNVD